jgi:hypothetical protein
MAGYINQSDPSASSDVMLMVGGERYTVVAGPVLRRNKWRGGIFVMFAPSNEGDFVVERSDGTAVAGYMLNQSEFYYPLPPPYGDGPGSPQNLTSYQYTEGVGGQNVVTMVLGGRAYFKQYETISLVGGVRNGPPIVYSLNDNLYVSENGLLTNEDTALAAVGITDPVLVGIVSAVPAPRNQFRLGVDGRD